MKYCMTEVPILFLGFNRPDTTRKVFEKIREAQPLKLYVAADGPRENNQDEIAKCEQVRTIATNVDWDCEVKTLFRDENLGCKFAVSGAIDWFFENEEMGIILEDDCLPNESFFKFCEQLLYRYRGKEKVMTISGNNFQPQKRTDNSYYFSKFMHCWGWATWRRAWNNFDLEMSDWPMLKKGDFLVKLFKEINNQKHWEQKFDRAYANEIDSWAYIWQYSIWRKKGINILPEKNLVSNIGFGSEGTHTRNKTSTAANLETFSLNFPLEHPKQIIINNKADKYTQNKHFNPPFVRKVFNKFTEYLPL